MSAVSTDLLVLGAGPGGYAAAFHAVDRGKKVILVERDKRLGGVCLNVGCIPSKALLHAAHIVEEAKASSERGLTFAPPAIDLKRMVAWKESILDKLGGGISALAARRKVGVVQGKGHFEDSHTLRVETPAGQQFITFEKAVIAVGSRPAVPAAFDLGNPRIMTSTGALALEEIPENLLVVGGGYIGMELSTVYAALGSAVTVVEALPNILTGADADLARPVMRYAKKALKEVRLGVKVQKMATAGKKIKVIMEADGKTVEELYDRVLVSIGRVPNTRDLGLENTKVALDEKGFVKVNDRQETADPAFYAIGDVAGGVLLAHKAAMEARVAVEHLSGEPSSSKNVVIPAVVFTHPEVAWCGLTEDEAKKGTAVDVARFPWSASGRALTLDKTDGLTKLIVEPGTERVLGVGIVGQGAGDLISEGALAVEMGASAEDLARTVHPHPTLSETLMEAAEVFYGHSVHTYSPRKEA